MREKNERTKKCKVQTLRYAHEMGRIEVEPQGAALMTPTGPALGSVVLVGGMTGLVGKKGVKCFFL